MILFRILEFVKSLFSFSEKHTFFLPFIFSVIGIYSGILSENIFIIIGLFFALSTIFIFLRGFLFLLPVISLFFALRVFFLEKSSEKAKIFFGEVSSLSYDNFSLLIKRAKDDIDGRWEYSGGYLIVKFKENPDFLVYDKVLVWCKSTRKISPGVKICNPYFVKKVGEGGIFQRIRERGREIFRNFALFPDEVALLDSMIFGARESVKNEVYFEFSKFGITHIIAISGSHFTLIALLGYFLGEIIYLLTFFVVRNSRVFVNLKFPQPYLFRLTFSILFQFIFLFISGFSGSAFRAFIMNLIFSFLLLSGRPYNSLNALFSSGFFIILINPFDLFNLSFLLSFSAVLFLILFPSLSAGKVFGIISTSVFCSLATFPFFLERGLPFSLIGPISNIIFLPLLSSVIAIGIIAVALGFIFEPLASLPILIASVIIKISFVIMEIFSIPAEILTVNPKLKFPAPILFVLLTLFLLVLKRNLNWKMFFALSSLIFVIIPTSLNILSRERTYAEPSFVVKEVRELKGIKVFIRPLRKVDENTIYKFISKKKNITCVFLCDFKLELEDEEIKKERFLRKIGVEECYKPDCDFTLKDALSY